MGMAEVILKGTTNAPSEGSKGAFYGAKFVFSYVDWLTKIAEVINDANTHNPALMTKKVHKGEYVYFYEMSTDGHWESKYFTTSTIAAGPTIDRAITKDEAWMRERGIMKMPKVAGAHTGVFHPHQYIRTKEEWRRATAIANAYIGDENIAKWQEDGYHYWYRVDQETGFWHSMFFTCVDSFTEE